MAVFTTIIIIIIVLHNGVSGGAGDRRPDRMNENRNNPESKPFVSATRRTQRVKLLASRAGKSRFFSVGVGEVFCRKEWQEGKDVSREIQLYTK